MRLGEEALEAVAAEWDCLADQMRVPPFLRPGWFDIWWRCFGKGELSVVTARRDGRLVGVLPICRRGGALLSPTNWHTPLYGPVVTDIEVGREIFGYLFEPGARRLELSLLDSGVASQMLAARPKGMHQEIVLRSPYLPIEGEWEPFWRSRSKNLRGTIRRCRNRLAELGKPELVVDPGLLDLETHLAEGLRLENSGWKEERGTAIAARPETRRFYSELAEWAAKKGILRLAFLRIEGRPVAFNYCFEQYGVHYLIKLGHEYELHRYGPGTVLTAEMVERAFREGLESYEFLGGPDRYKLRWSELCRDRLRIQAFSRSPAGRLEEIVQVHGRRIARRLLR